MFYIRVHRALDMETTHPSSTPEKVVLDYLREHPGGVPIDDLVNALSGIDYKVSPERLAREVAQDLVENGKARFNDRWLLELAHAHAR